MPVFTVRSAMSKKDWRKFLFTATFRRNPKVLLSIDAVALLAAFLLSWDSVTGFSLMRLALFFVFFFLAAAAAVACMTEKANLRRMGKNQHFGEETVFQFYEDKLGIRAPGVRQQSRLAYDQFDACLESRDFFVFYVTPEEGIALCKRDAEDPDGLREFIKARFGARYGKL